MCGPLGLRSGVLGGGLAREAEWAADGSEASPARNAQSSWRPDGGIPSTSGCDSSDCAYCQALARMRQPAAAEAAEPRQPQQVCWLRKKRSRTDLAAMDAPTPTTSGGSAPPSDEAPCSMSRAPSSNTLLVPDTAPADQQQQERQQRQRQRLCSMWDHALLEDGTQAAGLAYERQQRHQELRHGALEAGSQEPAASSNASSDSSPGGGGGAGAGAGIGSSSTGGSSGGGASGDGCSGGGANGDGCSGGGTWRPSWESPAVFQEVAAFVPPPAHRQRQATDIVCAMEFEEHGWLLASAGVTKQVRVYSLASCMQHPDEPAYRQPIRCHRMPSKLSSLAWNPDAPGAVTVADYDGVLSQVDLESGHLIAEADEHCGRRVWSVSHSLQRPHLCASASDDGTVRLWGGSSLHRCVSALRPAGGAPACGVHLSPFDGNLAAVACADHCAYVYDLRRADRPLLKLSGHARAVSYVRWLAAGRLITASTDASLAIWRLPGHHSAAAVVAAAATDAAHLPVDSSAAAAALTDYRQQQQQVEEGADGLTVLTHPWKRLQGHRNSKNFCGLSVRPEDGLVACGSEAAACYTYHESWSCPLAVHKFSAMTAAAGAGSGGVVQLHPGTNGAAGGAAVPPQPGKLEQQHPPQAPPAASQFCSAVCWQPATARLGAPPLLAAAMSSGELRVLELHRPEATAASRRCLDG